MATLLHPIRTFRSLQPFGWARESVILLCMQALDGHIDMRLEALVVLAVPQGLASQRRADSNVHSAGQQVRGEFAKMGAAAR